MAELAELLAAGIVRHGEVRTFMAGCRCCPCAVARAGHLRAEVERRRRTGQPRNIRRRSPWLVSRAEADRLLGTATCRGCGANVSVSQAIRDGWHIDLFLPSFGLFDACPACWERYGAIREEPEPKPERPVAVERQEQLSLDWGAAS